MKSEYDIAEAVLFAERIKQQRREAGTKQRQIMNAKGYKKIAVYVPIEMASELRATIRQIVQDRQRSI